MTGSRGNRATAQNGQQRHSEPPHSEPPPAGARPGPARPAGLGRRLSAAALSRSWGLPARRNRVLVTRKIPVPMRDGVCLLADHYAPVAAGSQPTILIRSPYGRGFMYGTGNAQILAERGYHVLLQSTRGTFGSGGTFRPVADEAADGRDTADWLRRQDWFHGRLATFGPSYLGFAQWALALDPPPELAAMVVMTGFHDLSRSCYEQGPFELYNRMAWSDTMAHQEDGGAVSRIVRTVRARRRLAPALGRLPLRGAMEVLGGRPAPWFDEWLDHPDPAGPYWAPRRATDALRRVTVPVLLIGGWHDLFLTQTLDQFAALRGRGVETALTVGPWTHFTVDAKVTMPECLAWLDRHVAGREGPGRRAAVRVFTGGARRWDDRPGWPPAGTEPRTWYLSSRHGDGLLGETPPRKTPPAETPPAEAAPGETPPGEARGTTAFRYDPADPTPSAGGRLLGFAAGARDNAAAEARADVLTFTTEPLPRAVEVQGSPVADLHVESDNAHGDLFVRLCDVDAKGRSVNVTDRIVRHGPGDTTPGQVRVVRVTLDPTAHRFLAGHRIRLQVSGGAHPRFARNLGTGEDPVTGTATRPVTHTVHHHAAAPSRLTLPTERIDPAGPGGPASPGDPVSPGDPADPRCPGDPTVPA